MITINEQHTTEYFMPQESISPEEILIAIEEMDLNNDPLEQDCIELLASPPSNWPSLN